MIAKTQMETGHTPKGPLKKNDDLRRAVNLKNRMDGGITYRPEDMSYRDLKAFEIVNGAINDVKNQKMQEMQKEAESGW